MYEIDVNKSNISVVELPNGKYVKEAYGDFYDVNLEDVEIELSCIRELEKEQDILFTQNYTARNKWKTKMKAHYRRCIAILSPLISAGWNRWSEDILDLFLDKETHKVIWGSGNCGKSITCAMLLYVKWRVNPGERMVLVASKIVKDASARVIGYIKDIHLRAPESKTHKFQLADSHLDKGVYCCIYSEEKKRWVKNDRACIVNLPVKVDGKSTEIGGNLIGKHPTDRLIIAFDEAQELPGKLAGERIFLNWYSNPRLDVVAWGNPQPAEWMLPDTWDLLFKLGVDAVGSSLLKFKRLEATKSKITSTWKGSDTHVLHLCMLDSPKDYNGEDIEEWWEGEGGADLSLEDVRDLQDRKKEAIKAEKERLSFLGGKENADYILSKGVNPETAAWYSQVLGFPFVNTSGSKSPSVVTPLIVEESKKLPLRWKDVSTTKLYMGVDSSQGSSKEGHDATAIVIARAGMMQDGRPGIDLMNGAYNQHVPKVANEEFTDTIVKTMYDISVKHGIPLNHIGVETHATGEVLRYALQKFIEGRNRWHDDYVERGQNYYIVSPVAAVSKRPLFKHIGQSVMTKDFVHDCTTEYWVAIRCAFQSKQLFNAPENILRQLYNRFFIENTSNKYRMENKKELRRRGVRSPNDADALAIVLETIRRRGDFRYVFNLRGKDVPIEKADDGGNRKTVEKRLGMLASMLSIGGNFVPHDQAHGGDMYAVRRQNMIREKSRLMNRYNRNKIVSV